MWIFDHGFRRNQLHQTVSGTRQTDPGMINQKKWKTHLNQRVGLVDILARSLENQRWLAIPQLYFGNVACHEWNRPKRPRSTHGTELIILQRNALNLIRTQKHQYLWKTKLKSSLQVGARWTDLHSAGGEADDLALNCLFWLETNPVSGLVNTMCRSKQYLNVDILWRKKSCNNVIAFIIAGLIRLLVSDGAHKKAAMIAWHGRYSSRWECWKHKGGANYVPIPDARCTSSPHSSNGTIPILQLCIPLKGLSKRPIRSTFCGELRTCRGPGTLPPIAPASLRIAY